VQKVHRRLEHREMLACNCHAYDFNPGAVRTNAQSLADRIPIEKITRKLLVDDSYLRGIGTIARQESSSGQNWNAKRFEVLVADIIGCDTRGLLAAGKLKALRRYGFGSSTACHRQSTGQCCRLHAGQVASAFDQCAIELLSLLGRVANLRGREPHRDP